MTARFEAMSASDDSELAPAVQVGDERPHHPGLEPLWNESWYFDWATDDGLLGGYVRIGLYPNLGVAWYWACLVGDDRPLVTVIDHEVPLPTVGLEIRTEGLWADHNIESPLDHWSLGLEAFAVGTDTPADALGDLRGDKVPFGLDLEWETDGTPYLYPGLDRYEIPCRVYGDVLVGNERFEIEASGQRDHSWGVRDWWKAEWCWTSATFSDGTRINATDVRNGEHPLYSAGYRQVDGKIEPLTTVERTDRFGISEPDGTTLGLTLEGGDIVAIEVDAVAHSPVPLVSSDGRRAELHRALCRYSTPDGHTGIGWTEWNTH